MLKPKFIYFDVGGVLLHFIQIQQMLADAWGVSLASYLTVRQPFEVALAEGTVDEFFVESEIKRQLKLDLPRGFWADFKWVEDFKPIPEMHQLVADLVPHYRLGLLTNVAKGVFAKGMSIPGMYPDVPWEISVRSFEVGLAKPKPEIYELAIEKTGLQPEEILFVDDMAINILAAAKTGLQVFQYDPDHVVKKTAELRKLLLP